MEIIIKTTNVKLNQALREWVEKKLGSLKKFYQDLSKEDILPSGKKEQRQEVFVEIGKITRGQRKGNVFRAEAQMRFQGKSVRAEAVSKDLRMAITQVKDKLQRKIKAFKEKKRAEFERGARRFKRSTKVSKQAKREKEGERVVEEGI